MSYWRMVHTGDRDSQRVLSHGCGRLYATSLFYTTQSALPPRCRTRGK